MGHSTGIVRPALFLVPLVSGQEPVGGSVIEPVGVEAEPELVLVETLSSGISLRDSEDVGLYVRHFERLWQVAATGDAARALLTAALQDLDADAPP